MKHLEWSEENSVGDQELDEHHRQFIKMANEIIDLVAVKNFNSDDLLIQLTNLGNQVMYHFDVEEQYLREKKMEGVEDHVALHNEYRVKIRTFIDEARDQQVLCKSEGDCHFLGDQAANFITDWVQNHMLHNHEAV